MKKEPLYQVPFSKYVFNKTNMIYVLNMYNLIMYYMYNFTIKPLSICTIVSIFHPLPIAEYLAESDTCLLYNYPVMSSSFHIQLA
jgi:hypothetical protein